MTFANTRRPLLLLALVAVLLSAASLALANPGSAGAHPLGNFTVNRYSRIEVYSDVIRLHYVLDMAEIPTFQENADVDANGDGSIDAAEAQVFADSKATEVATKLNLVLNGERADLSLARTNATFPEGQGGLLTTRLDAVYETPTPSGSASLAFEDANYGDRIGWREIVVLHTGASLTGDYPTQDVSNALTEYPGDLLSSPLETRSVAFTFDAASAPVAQTLMDPPMAVDAPPRSGAGFASLINTDDRTIGAVLLALLAAFAFGAIHAVEPGHGKTLVAAYFVGVKGTVRQALGLGLIVAVTHTVGVLAIGTVAIFGSHWILPERLYPWLSLASGLMVMALGLRLIVSRGGGRILHKLSHLPLFGHHHGHDHQHETPLADGVPPWRTLIGIGLADGLTPSPSALVVLLAAVSLNRIGLGIALIVAFSVGLAVVLAGISLGLLVFKQTMDVISRRASSLNLPFVGTVAGAFSAEGTAMRALPLTGAIVLLVAGVALTVRAIGAPGMSL